MHQKALTIHYCGHENCAPGHSFGPAIRSHYLIHFILKGKGYYQVNGEIFTIEEGSAFLIKPNETTFYQADYTTPWEYVWIACSGTEAERIFEDYNLCGSQYICSWTDRDAVKNFLFRILDAYMNSRDNKDELLGWFYLIFSRILKHASDKQPPDKGYYQKAEQYIRHNYGYNISITDISNYVGIDRTYLFKLFKKYSGVSPKQFLTAHRVAAAKNMLIHTSLSVTEIALSCGFRDSSSFCKIFNSQVGTSPLKYRKVGCSA